MESDITKTSKILVRAIEASEKAGNYVEILALTDKLLALYHNHPDTMRLLTIDDMARITDWKPAEIVRACFDGIFPHLMLPGPEKDTRRHKSRLRFTRDNLRDIISLCARYPNRAHRRKVA